MKASDVLARPFRGRLRESTIRPSRVEVRTASEKPGGLKASANDSADQAFEEDIITLCEYHFISVAL